VIDTKYKKESESIWLPHWKVEDYENEETVTRENVIFWLQQRSKWSRWVQLDIEENWLKERSRRFCQ